MKNFNNILPFAILILLLIVSINVDAQCAMCKAQAQTSMQANDPDASSLNRAILYLFLTPYAIVGIIGFVWYRNRKVIKDQS
jgi:hypothetical protein